MQDEPGEIIIGFFSFFLATLAHFLRDMGIVQMLAKKNGAVFRLHDGFVICLHGPAFSEADE
ncbi:hypothetical protein ACFLW4_05725 [Chloroflexota bacterium]